MSDSQGPGPKPGDVQHAPPAAEVAQPNGRDNAPEASSGPEAFLTGEQVTPTPPKPTRETTAELEQILQYDFFSPAEVAKRNLEGQQAAKDGQSPLVAEPPVPQRVSPTPAAPPVAPVAVAPAPSAAPPAPDPRDQTIAELRRNMETLQGVVKQLSQAVPAAGAPQAPAPAEEDFGFPDTNYVYNVNDELVALLNAEDPKQRATTLAGLLTQVSKIIHSNVVKAVRKELPTRMAPMLEQQLQETNMRTQIQNDYYGKFPHHRALAHIVRDVTPRVFAEMGATGWSEAVRDRVGEQVQALIMAAVSGGQALPPAAQQVVPQAPGQVVQAAAVQAAGVPTPNAGSRPPHMFGGTASPAVGPNAGPPAPNSPEAISATIF